MKKLMIAAAIVCAAVMAQASCAISWNTNGKQLVDDKGVALTSLDNIVLVVMGSATGWDSATAISVGSSSDIDKTTMSISSGRISGTVKFTWADGADNLIDNGDYLALMYNGKNGLEQLKYYQADGKGALVDATFGAVSGISNNSYSKTGAKIAMTGNFTAPVPEPTSGLLLVLGMAGLALRRRRA